MKKQYTLRYRRATVRLAKNPRKKKCECCGKYSKMLQAHHWKYVYETKEVKANPKLATENITTLCYKCHLIANALKLCIENWVKVKKMLDFLPEDMMEIVEEWE